MERFERMEIVVLATTEQNTLKDTIEILLTKCDKKDISEIVILMVSDSCPSASVAKEIVENNSSGVPVSIHIQKTPGLYPALYEATTIVRDCTHFLVIGSDLEMDPNSVPGMIEKSKENPDAVICASKFMKGSYREKYGLFHYLFNRSVNTAVGLIAGIRGTELLSTFQIYPADLLREMNFTDLYRTYYQYAFRPVVEKAKYIEIPTDYIRRTEGASNYNPKRYIDLGLTFIKTALDERKRKKNESK